MEMRSQRARDKKETGWFADRKSETVPARSGGVKGSKNLGAPFVTLAESISRLAER